MSTRKLCDTTLKWIQTVWITASNKSTAQNYTMLSKRCEYITLSHVSTTLRSSWVSQLTSSCFTGAAQWPTGFELSLTLWVQCLTVKQDCAFKLPLSGRNSKNLFIVFNEEVRLIFPWEEVTRLSNAKPNTRHEQRAPMFSTALDIFHPCPKERKTLYQAACDHLKDVQDYQRGDSRKSSK